MGYGLCFLDVWFPSLEVLFLFLQAQSVSIFCSIPLLRLDDDFCGHFSSFGEGLYWDSIMQKFFP